VRISAGDRHAVLAGVVSAVVGFTGSFAVVLTGLRAVGASPAQAASGLAVLSVTMGVGCIWFAVRTRVPITIAWSTPGAALLATSAAPAGGFAAAVGAFACVGLLLLATALVKPLGELVRRIPTPLASAMLAGVLVQFCMAPFVSLAKDPLVIAPVLVTWLALLRLARRWAVPGALLTAGFVMAAKGTYGRIDPTHLLPTLEWTMPTVSPAALVALTVPLYIVTMTSQNIPGVAVLASFGYEPDVRAPLAYTGVATMVGAPFGGHAINLAAIAAALAAGPEAHSDRNRRWLAALACGVVYVGFGPLSALVSAIAVAAPTGLLTAVAGVALIGTFASSAAAAMGDASHREAAAVTFLVAASGFTVAGIGSAFWALALGLVLHVALTPMKRARSSSRA
jgi:benzoate membrane transport protein